MTCTQIKYLVAIKAVSNSNNRARVVDIADKLGYSKPSVTRTVDTLLFYGFCVRNEDKTISLTEIGKNKVLMFEILRNNMEKFLHESLRLPRLLANTDAINVLYAMPQESIKFLINNLNNSGVTDDAIDDSRDK